MTEITHTTETAEQLEQRARAARQQQQARDAEEFARREVKALAYAEEQLAGYDQAEHQRTIREARGAFFDAVTADPVWSALLTWKAAEWRAVRAGHTAAGHSQTVARAAGDLTPRIFDAPTPLPIEVTILAPSYRAH